MKGKTGASNDDGAVEKRTQRRFNGQYSKAKIDKRNMQRLGGRGLSLQTFANAKSLNPNHYNPALIKKQREFYKNAKFVKKYKRLRQEERQSEVPMARRHFEERNETEEATKVNQNNKKDKKSGAHSLEETWALYQTKREEEEKARIEREASIRAKKDEKQRAEAQRKSLKEKMFKKTKSGQPVMKYRIQHILETLQGSSG